MNRPIKFRAWVNENSNRYKPHIMWSWEEIWDNTYIEVPGKMILHHGLNPEMSGVQLMQFTGLLDKNGKEIYEGDIVKLDFWSTNQQVKFIEGAFCLADKDGDYSGDIHYIHHAEIPQASVIGNIFENPELLTSQR
jgi:uncharacterized phage protein (TIGR01671 family)